MYGALWRAIPGPWPVKLLVYLALIAAVLYALVTWVFPWVDANIVLPNTQDITVSMGMSTSGVDVTTVASY
ncbi:hypothetical protein [Gulosibacter molinativorax]|uniref:Uncharacterized protein n=1 Tax=Gulosibacter molinativorax TaxID=256821 RepID=A0ABT7C7P0_9MICO|nr:hypothetical protein [Gulosibacter molinativorax]MDJ1371256.1 hypothetical protein [Gulosibacter molinativorax]QUY63072.1 Hypotetical protein [Gulosibacter molinativorax]